MKRTSKFALLVGAALAAAGTVRAAQGDLLAGFYSGGNFSYVLNIGSAGSLYAGETWDVSGGLSSAGINPNGASFGVVGYALNGSTLYLTKGSGPNPDLSNSDWASATGFIDGIGANTGVQAVPPGGGQSEDWFTQTMNQYNPGANLIGALAGYNVNGTQPGGATLVAEDQYTRNPSGFLNAFTLSGAGILTYVPEPSALGFAGLGFLVLGFLRRVGKQ